MSRHAVALMSCVTALLVSAAPAVADTSKSVTATGTKLVKVVPANRNSNASIRAAVDAAEQAGIQGAIAVAHEYALRYAAAAGLTLGGVISVSDAQNNGVYFGPYGSLGFFGPFGPDQYCGTQQIHVVKRVHKKLTVVTKKVDICVVPPYEVTTLTVTFAAT